MINNGPLCKVHVWVWLINLNVNCSTIIDALVPDWIEDKVW